MVRQEPLLVEQSPDDGCGEGSDGEQPPKRPERKRDAQDQHERARVHGVTHNRVRPRLHHRLSSAHLDDDEVKVFSLKTRKTTRKPSATRIFPAMTATRGTRDQEQRWSSAERAIVAANDRPARAWMIFWRPAFSAAGPARTLRSRSLGSFFIR
jgi:hypothetical protein